MNKIGAIETRYKGYRMRSRLEARWAIFFDVMNIKWMYELEGYRFSDGTHYLPDFYLPEVNLWAEVKPTELSVDEWFKAALLSEATARGVLQLTGEPDFREYKIASHVPHDDGLYHSLIVHPRWYYEEKRFPCMFCSTPESFEYWDPYYDAVMAARAARFEHGETP